MGLGDITKQLANEVIGAQKTKVLDSILPPDPVKKPETPAPPPELGNIIFGQIAAMQRACKDDTELVLKVHAAGETLRVLEMYAPNWQLFVLTGVDAEGQTTRIVTPVATIQLVSKVVKIPSEAKPVRIQLIAPKPPAA